MTKGRAFNHLFMLLCKLPSVRFLNALDLLSGDGESGRLDRGWVVRLISN